MPIYIYVKHIPDFLIEGLACVSNTSWYWNDCLGLVGPIKTSLTTALWWKSCQRSWKRNVLIADALKLCLLMTRGLRMRLIGLLNYSVDQILAFSPFARIDTLLTQTAAGDRWKQRWFTLGERRALSISQRTKRTFHCCWRNRHEIYHRHAGEPCRS
jgi:hypothetical protein